MVSLFTPLIQAACNIITAAIDETRDKELAIQATQRWIETNLERAKAGGRGKAVRARGSKNDSTGFLRRLKPSQLVAAAGGHCSSTSNRCRMVSRIRGRW